MMQIGLVEIAPGHWISPDGMKEISDFDGGVLMITRISAEQPEFDVVTTHMGAERTAEFLNDCLKQHIEEIRRLAIDIENRGKSALRERAKS